MGNLGNKGRIYEVPLLHLRTAKCSSSSQCVKGHNFTPQIPQRIIDYSSSAEKIKEVINSWTILSETTDRQAWSPLMRAIKRNNVGKIKRLIKQSARDVINYNDNNGTTALMIAARNNSAVVIRLLLENGAEIDAVDKESFTALTYAAAHNALAAAQALILMNANINHRLQIGATPLIIAVLFKSADLVQLLLKHGAGLEHTDHDDLTALKYASAHNTVDIVALLLKNGANVNQQQQQDDITALIISVLFNSARTMKLLIENGADLEATYDSGMTALLIAAARETIVIESESCGGSNIYTTDENSAIPAQLLIESGANIEATDENGSSALMYASKYNAVKSTKLLIQKGAKINLKSKHKTTALMIAAKRNTAEVMKLLINQGANLDDTDDDNDTALIYATKHNSKHTAKLLIQHGANIQHRNNSGTTAMAIAEEEEYMEIKKLLLDYGAGRGTYTPFITPNNGTVGNKSTTYTQIQDVCLSEDTTPLEIDQSGIFDEIPDEQEEFENNNVPAGISCPANTNTRKRNPLPPTPTEPVPNTEAETSSPYYNTGTLNTLENNNGRGDRTQLENDNQQLKLDTLLETVLHQQDEMKEEIRNIASKVTSLHRVHTATREELFSKLDALKNKKSTKVGREYFKDQNLMKIATYIGAEQKRLAVHLGLDHVIVQQILIDAKSTIDASFLILLTWKNLTEVKGDSEKLQELIVAFQEVGRPLMEEKIKEILGLIEE